MTQIAQKFFCNVENHFWNKLMAGEYVKGLSEDLWEFCLPYHPATPLDQPFHVFKC